VVLRKLLARQILKLEGGGNDKPQPMWSPVGFDEEDPAVQVSQGGMLHLSSLCSHCPVSWLVMRFW
jgi:hypothetical protein